MREGGAEFLAECRKLGRTPKADELPPPLGWEAPVWGLYQRLSRQWRVSMAGPVGLDLAVFLPFVERYGWDAETALDLLGVIEAELLRRDEPPPGLK